MVTQHQINGALGMLGWSNAVASEKSGIAISTIQRARAGKKIIAANMSVLVGAFEDAGIEFASDGGVKLNVNKTKPSPP